MATKKRDNRDSEEWVIIIFTVPSCFVPNRILAASAFVQSRNALTCSFWSKRNHVPHAYSCCNILVHCEL
jgi:hypothetical protein